MTRFKHLVKNYVAHLLKTFPTGTKAAHRQKENHTETEKGRKTKGR